MTTQFLHGVETVDIKQGTPSVKEVRSGVIGLIGTAPQGDINTLTLCLSSSDDAKFGQPTADTTIPYALKSLREMGVVAILVINVGATASVADLIGTTDETGKRTGLQHFLDGYGIFGFDAKIVISPSFSTIPTVASAMQSLVNRIRAVSYVDMPLGLTPQEVVASRGNASPLGLDIYQTQSTRVRICYPHRKVFDPVTSQTRLEPASIAFAGVRAYIDRTQGYWTSSSNKEVVGTLGLERLLTARIDDPDSEVNLLNSAGISTFFKSHGTGFLSWGNRSASYPTITDYENFEQVQRTKDMIEESLHQSSLQFVDKDIKQAQIDSLTEFANNYIRLLVMRGAVVDGKAFFDVGRNPPSELTNGHIRIGYKFTPIFPMERITYEREVTGEFLLNLKSVNLGGLQMSITVHKITQGNAYLNGVNLLGKVESVDNPDIKFIFDEFKAMGMVGKVELPTTGIDKMEGKMKFNSIYPDTAKLLSPFKSNQLQVRSNVQVHGNHGVISNVPLVTFMTVTFKNMPTGKFEQHKSVDGEYDFTCTYFKQVYDGYEIVEIDALANIVKINGEDVLKEYRENLGM